jgi:branched-chain amino acid transport system substrate-binding protein
MKSIQNLIFFILTTVVYHNYVEAVPQQVQGPEWKIGVLLCLTGSCESFGTNALNGIKLAEAELNGQGGVLGKKVQLIIQDTMEADSPSYAISAYRNLSTDKEVAYFIGPALTPAGFALGPIVAKEQRVIMTSPSLGVSAFNEAGDNLFNARGSDEQCSRLLAKYVYDHGWRTSAIFSSQQEWDYLQGIYFQNEFEKLGGKVLQKVTQFPNQFDIKTEALKVVKANADGLFIASTFQIGNVAKTLHSLGYSGAKVAPYLDYDLFRSADGKLNGTIFTTLALASSEFNQVYREKFNTDADPVSAVAYDTLMNYAAAIRTAGTFDTSVVKQRLLNTQSDGASGQFRFDSKGGAMRRPILMHVAGDRLEQLK